MRKVYLFALVGAMSAGIAMSSCSKDDDKDTPPVTVAVTPLVPNPDGTVTIAATVENGSIYTVEVDTVKAVFLLYANQKENVIASAPYQNGAFTLNLPATIADEYLNDWSSRHADVVDVKGEDFARIEAYKNGKRVGCFMYADESGHKLCMWEYVNKAAGFDFGGTATFSFNKGWSLIYYDEERDECTTTEPNGLKWRFFPGNK